MLKIISLTVSWSLGWKVVTAKKMLFENIGNWAKRKAKTNKMYDVFICEWCIPNAHGLFFVWPLAFGIGIIPFEWNYKYLLMYPFCLGASSFITGMLWDSYLTMNAKRDYYKSETKI